MSIQMRIVLRSDVEVRWLEEGSVRITSPLRSWSLRDMTSGVCAAMQALTATDGAEENRLADLVLAFDGAGGLAVWYYELDRMRAAGFLSDVLVVDGAKIATWTPMAADVAFALGEVDASERFALSRYAWVRRDPQGQGLLLETPLAPVHVVLHGTVGGAVLAALSEPVTISELADRVVGCTPELAALLLSLLSSAQLLDEADRHPSLPAWEFHDLLFHSRSRLGRHDAPAGATYHLAKNMSLPSVVKPLMSTDVVTLTPSALEVLMQRDPPLSQVMEERRSLRQQDDDHPLTIKQLGEFLYRTARLRHRNPATETRVYESSDCPYPNGGAMYELELYVVANRCSGLERGVYQYDPEGHQLCRVRDLDGKADQLLQDAQRRYGASSAPQVLFLITARFARVSWKYQSMAYSLVLKNVGALYQTMYLNATAMGLAPCALGSGDADLFAGYEEPLVGEFVLGTRN